MEESAEPVKADLERARSEIELRIKEVELDIKRAELKSKLEEKTKRVSASSPLTLAIITGILGLFAAGVANVFQTRSNLELERQKLESSLILKAIETDKPEASARNLLWLLKAELIRDPSHSIEKLNATVPNTASSRQIFFDRYAADFGPLTEEKKAVLIKLFDFIEKDRGIRDVRHVAYILATIKWETADKWQPLAEYGTDIYLEGLYGPGTSMGKSLGNTEPGDGARFKGRGYLQVTGKARYQRMNELLGLAGTDNDLVKYPEKALDPLISYRVTSEIMLNGTVTGKKLSDFINADKTDYTNARRIIAGLDHAAELSAAATKFEATLRDSLTRKN
jgi:hypothetical protein